MAIRKPGSPIKLAMFRDLSTNAEYYSVFQSDSEFTPSGYVRVSEEIELIFPPLGQEAVAGQILGALDAKEKKVREEFETQLTRIENMRANFLALTGPKEAPVDVSELFADELPF